MRNVGRKLGYKYLTFLSFCRHDTVSAEKVKTPVVLSYGNRACARSAFLGLIG
jgi:hypothetical protein